MKRIIAFGGLCWGPLVFGKYHILKPQRAGSESPSAQAGQKPDMEVLSGYPGGLTGTW